LLTGAWKNLLSGVTNVVHHDPWEREFEDRFPIHVVRIATADSVAALPANSLSGDAPTAVHMAEGVDEGAAAEIRAAHARGLLTERLLAVHSVGADADGMAKLREAGCALVWCPTSNRFLFGRSAPLALLESVDVLLGSDSLLTGAGTLLDEIRAARGTISDQRLLDAVGPLAARRLGISPLSLAPGAPADLALFRCAALDAALKDVLLVIVAGEPRVVAPELMPHLGLQGGRKLIWRGVERWISAEETMLL
jgi:cytosine/adenosine deaminase-related metal-dependent hydrolase